MCCTPPSCIFAAAAILKILLFFVVAEPRSQDHGSSSARSYCPTSGRSFHSYSRCLWLPLFVKWNKLYQYAETSFSLRTENNLAVPTIHQTNSQPRPKLSSSAPCATFLQPLSMPEEARNCLGWPYRFEQQSSFYFVTDSPLYLADLLPLSYTRTGLSRL